MKLIRTALLCAFTVACGGAEDLGTDEAPVLGAGPGATLPPSGTPICGPGPHHTETNFAYGPHDTFTYHRNAPCEAEVHVAPRATGYLFSQYEFGAYDYMFGVPPEQCGNAKMHFRLFYAPDNLLIRDAWYRGELAPDGFTCLVSAREFAWSDAGLFKITALSYDHLGNKGEVVVYGNDTDTTYRYR